MLQLILSHFLGHSQLPICHFLRLLQLNCAISHTAFQIARLNLGFGRFSALPLPLALLEILVAFMANCAARGHVWQSVYKLYSRRRPMCTCRPQCRFVKIINFPSCTPRRSRKCVFISSREEAWQAGTHGTASTRRVFHSSEGQEHIKVSTQRRFRNRYR